MIVVVDYDVGNVKSVCNAFDHIGCDVKLSCDVEQINWASGLVLPGVAAFGYAAKALGSLADVLKDYAQSDKPLLGICVGYQLLFDRSCEHGFHEGLGLVSGDVILLPPAERVPHMGWNEVKLPENMDLFRNLPEQSHFYFAHSYYADITDSKTEIAYTEYGFGLPAAVQKRNIFGTQFHPEKSGPAGLQVLRNFARFCENAG